MSKRQNTNNPSEDQRPPTRLFLITPPLTSEVTLSQVERALEAGDVASLLIGVTAAEGREFAQYAKPLTEMAQEKGIAVLLRGDHRLARRLRADGVHVEDGAEALEEAVEALHPDLIVGAGKVTSRHEAMGAGESGADYVFFGNLDGEAGNELDALCERAQWWQSLFTAPCVVLAARHQEAGAIAAAGADFVALGPDLWLAPDEAPSRIATAQSLIDQVFAETAR